MQGAVFVSYRTLNGASCLWLSSRAFSWPPSWLVSSRLFSWPAFSQPSSLVSLEPVSWRLVSSWLWVLLRRRWAQPVRAWVRAWAQASGLVSPASEREARERVRAPRLPAQACRTLPLLLPLRNLLRATRYKRRYRRIRLLRHVRRAWGRRTSLLLLISVAAEALCAWLRAREN